MQKRTSINIPYLDGWRGLAICFLLIGHFFPIPGINLGTVGVDLFFVLSGFLMARLLFIDTVGIPLFYQRRAARIFPAVICLLTLATGFYLATGRSVRWAELAAAAALVNNYFPGEPGWAVMPFGHIWSLCVEEHSYILLSIIALAVRAHVIRANVAVGLTTALIATVSCIYYLNYQGRHFEFDRWIHSEVSAFGIFASAFVMLYRKDRTAIRIASPVMLALVGAGFIFHWWSVPPPIRSIFGVGAFALAINLLEGAPHWMHRAMSFVPLRRIGVWSFSVYLWQQPFYLCVSREGMSPWLGLSLALGAGIISFYGLENPARAYLNGKGASRRRIAAANTRPAKAVH